MATIAGWGSNNRVDSSNDFNTLHEFENYEATERFDVPDEAIVAAIVELYEIDDDGTVAIQQDANYVAVSYATPSWQHCAFIQFHDAIDEALLAQEPIGIATQGIESITTITGYADSDFEVEKLHFDDVSSDRELDSRSMPVLMGRCDITK